MKRKLFLQESDSVDNMEESCEDSDFLELVKTKFTRLVQTKNTELEYYYNPEVERNKGKNMKPLWEAAKTTVEGGMKELQEIIKDRRRNNKQESETLKLEVVERDLQILKMVNFFFEQMLRFKKNILNRNSSST